MECIHAESLIYKSWTLANRRWFAFHCQPLGYVWAGVICRTSFYSLNIVLFLIQYNNPSSVGVLVFTSFWHGTQVTNLRAQRITSLLVGSLSIVVSWMGLAGLFQSFRSSGLSMLGPFLAVGLFETVDIGFRASFSSTKNSRTALLETYTSEQWVYSISKCLIIFESVWSCSKVSDNIPKCLIIFQSVWYCSNVYDNVPSCVWPVYLCCRMSSRWRHYRWVWPSCLACWRWWGPALSRSANSCLTLGERMGWWPDLAGESGVF